MALKEKIQTLLDEGTDTIGYLYCRWQDEKEYEDINDYQKPLAKHFEKIGANITKMVKRPFGCKFTLDGKNLVMKVTNNRIKFEYAK